MGPSTCLDVVIADLEDPHTRPLGWPTLVEIESIGPISVPPIQLELPSRHDLPKRLIGQILDGIEVRSCQALVMCDVQPRTMDGFVGPRLEHMRPQQPARRSSNDMDCGVMIHQLVSTHPIDGPSNWADRQWGIDVVQDMITVRRDIMDVHLMGAIERGERAMVGFLTTSFGVEAGSIEDSHVTIPMLDASENLRAELPSHHVDDIETFGLLMLVELGHRFLHWSTCACSDTFGVTSRPIQR